MATGSLPQAGSHQGGAMRGGMTSALRDWGGRTELAGRAAFAVVLLLGFVAAFAITTAASRPDTAPRPDPAAAPHDEPRAGPSLATARLRNVAELPRLRGERGGGPALPPTEGAALSGPPAPAWTSSGAAAGPNGGSEVDARRPRSQPPNRVPIASPPAPTRPAPTSSRPRSAPAKPAPEFDSSGDSSGEFDTSG